MLLLLWLTLSSYLGFLNTGTVHRAVFLLAKMGCGGGVHETMTLLESATSPLSMHCGL